MVTLELMHGELISLSGSSSMVSRKDPLLKNPGCPCLGEFCFILRRWNSAFSRSSEESDSGISSDFCFLMMGLRLPVFEDSVVSVVSVLSEVFRCRRELSWKVGGSFRMQGAEERRFLTDRFWDEVGDLEGIEWASPPHTEYVRGRTKVSGGPS